MKTALVCSCSTGYVWFLKTLLKSVKANNGMKYPFIVLCHEDGRGWKPLFNYEREELKAIYPGTVFMDIDPTKYIERFGCNYLKYFSVEAFGLDEYDQVIYFGADMLNLKPLYEMEIYRPGCGLLITREIKRPDTFNNGGMIIRKPFLDKSLPEKLIMHDGRKGTGNDQALIASYFEGKITESDPRFNVLISAIVDDPVNLHYYIKPNEASFISRCGQELFDLYEKYRLMP